jgi:hypothetical protein
MELTKISFDNYNLDNILNYGKLDFYYNAHTDTHEANKNFIINDVILIENIDFHERNGPDFKIDIRNHNSPITIRNCVFQNKLNIEGKNVTNIIFDNVIFENGLSIKNFDWLNKDGKKLIDLILFFNWSDY